VDAPAVVAAADLDDFAARAFIACGVAPGHAAQWAKVLVWADLRGVGSHGVMRIPAYVAHLAAGEFNPKPQIRQLFAAGALSVIDADLAPGPVGMEAAMAMAMQGAREHRIGWCVARAITHPGAIGYYALRAAEAGLVGVAMSASQPLMAYFGARTPALSTNPIAIAVPAAGRPPIVLDMSTSTVSMGKVMQARASGQPIPSDWGVDRDGRPTTDPHAVEMLQPLGGAKGSGLSLMIECLTSLCAGLPLIEPVLSSGQPLAGRPMNGVAIALDVPDPERFRSEVTALARAIGALPPAEGVERVLLPGERGDAVSAERRRLGIPLPAAVVRALSELGDELGVPFPAVPPRR
jgi:ureidoglycolate dehydrogenase (NAD+)